MKPWILAAFAAVLLAALLLLWPAGPEKQPASPAASGTQTGPRTQRGGQVRGPSDAVTQTSGTAQNAATATAGPWSFAAQVVKAGDETPVSGAEVWLVGPGTRPPLRLISDENGRVAATDLPGYSYRLEIRAAGYAPVVDELLDLRDGGERRFGLQGGSGLSGRVTDADGNPLPTAEVTALSRFSPRGVPGDETSILTDHQGRFALLSLRPGVYFAEARSPGKAPARVGPFDLQSGDRMDDITIVLPDGGSIAGQVVDERGGGVAQARITAYDSDVSPRQLLAGQRLRPTASAYGDSGGAFTLTTLPRQGSMTLMAEAPGFVRGVAGNISIGRDDVQLRLTPMGAIDLTVVDDAAGEPVPVFEGCVALAASRDCAWRTFGNGRMLWEHLGPGTYRATVRSPRHSAVTAEHLVLAPGQTLRRTLRLAPGADITGTVVRQSDGSPLADAVVRVLNAGDIEYIHATVSPYVGGSMGGTRTGPDGRFVLSAPEDKPCQILATHDDYVGAVLAVPDPAEARDIVLRLADGGTLAGHIRDAAGKALEGVQVMARGDSMMKRGYSDETGAYELRGLQPGRTRVSVLFRGSGGDFSETEATVPVTAGKTYIRDFVRPDDGDRVARGRLLDAGGAAIQGYSVYVTTGGVTGENLTRDRMYYRALGGPVWRSSTDSEGVFEVDKLPADTPASALLFFNRHIPASPVQTSSAAWIAPLVVTARDQPPAHMVLQLPAGSAAGILRDTAGQPAPNGEIIITQVGPWGLWSVYGRSDTGGAFRLQPVFDAPMAIEAHHTSSGNALLENVTPANDIDIRLTPQQQEP